MEAPHAEPPEPVAEVPRETLIREAWIASLGILLLLGAVKHLAALVPFVGRYAFTIAAAAQLYIPIFLIGRRGITRDTLGLSFRSWQRDLKALALLAVLTTIPFAIGHHYWQTLMFKRTFNFRWPAEFWTSVAVQIFVIALAEEIYFRGYLQERLQRIWPAKRTLFGTPFGRAILVASAVFALAHFVGEYRPDRLGPFFPALLFGLLRARTGTLVGAIGYHAFCNILSEVLWECYRSS